MKPRLIENDSRFAPSSIGHPGEKVERTFRFHTPDGEFLQRPVFFNSLTKCLFSSFDWNAETMDHPSSTDFQNGAKSFAGEGVVAFLFLAIGP
jgi:hypothetical protein